MILGKHEESVKSFAGKMAEYAKEKMAEAMEIINKANPDLPISVGDVIIEEVFGSQIVAAKNLA